MLKPAQNDSPVGGGRFDDRSAWLETVQALFDLGRGRLWLDF